MKRIVFIAKTNLNNDGRILNELKILQHRFPAIIIDFILLPDIPLAIDLGENINVYNINLKTRHNKFLRLFTVIEFSIKALILLFKLNPDIIHAQDTAVVLPVLSYRLLSKNFRLIYDDHEIPNENENLQERIFSMLELKLMKRADFIIFANEERMHFLKERYNFKSRCSYFLNLLYFEEKEQSIEDIKVLRNLGELDTMRLNGNKFLIHQGPLFEERGRAKLADFSRILPVDFKILLLGGTKGDYNKFISEFHLNPNNFYFVGNVNYSVLPKFWERAIASIVMYLPTYINNRLCAPNRFYLSLQKGLPVIVNKDNPVLSNFIKKYECGFFIEELTESSIINNTVAINQQSNFSFWDIRNEQIRNFVEIYEMMDK